jgi:3-oxoacyl-[acyl-carrier-protein] synthase II
MNKTRIVITGLGAVTALGSSVPLLWEGLLAGRSGIRRITQFDPSPFPCQIAGEVPDFDVSPYMDRKEARRIPRFGQFGVAAAAQAVADAGLPDTMPNPERASIVFGTAIGGLNRVDEGLQTLRSQGYEKLNPFTVPTSIPNLPAFLIAHHFQCLGPNSTITTACATGTQTIGEGAEMLRRGVADVVITGGVEALIEDFAIGGFCAMRALPTNFNHCPEAASRPFDANREGFLYSEGAGAVVMETLEHALARGARIYAEFAGHASSTDGYHMAAPEPEALGPTRAMRWALKDAGMEPTEVDYINAHGTSTPLNDVTETRAIKNLFGEHAYKLAISSTKSMIGHAMGASGTLEGIACILSIYNSVIAPTINYETPDPECDLDYTPNHASYRPINTALSNSFGLGGQNACLIVKKYIPEEKA